MASKSIKLGNIAQIISGYTFRRPITNSSDGNCKVVQAKNITDNIVIDHTSLDSESIDYTKSNASIKKNDIILTSRGRFSSAILDSDYPAVASSSVFIVRTNSIEVDNYYLAIFLNSKIGQFELSRIISGSYIKSLLKKNLINLRILLPTVETQKQIVQLHKNINDQKKLLKRKLEINSAISQQAMYQIVGL